MMEQIVILLIALTLDLILGEPSNTWHPVVWLGKVISWETKLAPHKGKFRWTAYGASIVLVTFERIGTAIYISLAQLLAPRSFFERQKLIEAIKDVGVLSNDG